MAEAAFDAQWKKQKEKEWVLKQKQLGYHEGILNGMGYDKVIGIKDCASCKKSYKANCISKGVGFF